MSTSAYAARSPSPTQPSSRSPSPTRLPEVNYQKQMTRKLEREIVKMEEKMGEMPKLLEEKERECGVWKAKCRTLATQVMAAEHKALAMSTQYDHLQKTIEHQKLLLQQTDAEEKYALNAKNVRLQEKLNEATHKYTAANRQIELLHKNYSTELHGIKNKLHDAESSTPNLSGEIVKLENVIKEKDKYIASLLPYQYNAIHHTKKEECRVCKKRELEAIEQAKTATMRQEMPIPTVTSFALVNEVLQFTFSHPNVVLKWGENIDEVNKTASGNQIVGVAHLSKLYITIASQQDGLTGRFSNAQKIIIEPAPPKPSLPHFSQTDYGYLLSFLSSVYTTEIFIDDTSTARIPPKASHFLAAVSDGLHTFHFIQHTDSLASPPSDKISHVYIQKPSVPTPTLKFFSHSTKKDSIMVPSIRARISMAGDDGEVELRGVGCRSGTEVVFEDLKLDHPYDHRGRLRNEAGWGPWSEFTRTWTDLSLLPIITPSAPVIESTTTSSLVLTIPTGQLHPCITHYQIANDANGMMNIIASIPNGHESLQIDELDPSQEYQLSARYIGTLDGETISGLWSSSIRCILAAHQELPISRATTPDAIKLSDLPSISRPTTKDASARRGSVAVDEKIVNMHKGQPANPEFSSRSSLNSQAKRKGHEKDNSKITNRNVREVTRGRK